MRWVLRVPEAELELEFSTATPDQEFISFVCARPRAHVGVCAGGSSDTYRGVHI